MSVLRRNNYRYTCSWLQIFIYLVKDDVEVKVQVRINYEVWRVSGITPFMKIYQMMMMTMDHRRPMHVKHGASIIYHIHVASWEFLILIVSATHKCQTLKHQNMKRKSKALSFYSRKLCILIYRPSFCLSAFQLLLSYINWIPAPLSW